MKMTIEERKQFLSIAESAGILQIHPATIRRWICEGRIHGVRLGRKWVIERTALEKYLTLSGATVESAHQIHDHQTWGSTGQENTPAEPGALLMHGVRFGLFDVSGSLRVLREQLAELVGPERTALVMRRAGAAGAASVLRHLYHQPGKLAAQEQFYTALDWLEKMGLGRCTVQHLDMNQGQAVINVENTLESSWWQHESSPSHEPVCHYLSGFLQGLMTQFCLSSMSGLTRLHCQETDCRAIRGESCVFTVTADV